MTTCARTYRVRSFEIMAEIGSKRLQIFFAIYAEFSEMERENLRIFQTIPRAISGKLLELEREILWQFAKYLCKFVCNFNAIFQNELQIAAWISRKFAPKFMGILYIRIRKRKKKKNESENTGTNPCRRHGMAAPFAPRTRTSVQGRVRMIVICGILSSGILHKKILVLE